MDKEKEITQGHLEESGAERKRSRLGMARAIVKRTGWGGPGIAAAGIVKEE